MIIPVFKLSCFGLIGLWATLKHMLSLDCSITRTTTQCITGSNTTPVIHTFVSV